MRNYVLAVVVLGFTHTTAAGEISSAYTDVDIEQDCTTYASAAGEGDWSEMVCTGYRGYPVLRSYSDLRVSMFFGFPPATSLSWESFSAFNSA